MDRALTSNSSLDSHASKKANLTDLALTLFRKKHGRSEQTQNVQTLTPHVPSVVTFADHTKPLPWSTVYNSVLMFADISGFTSLCERYSSMGKGGIDQLTNTLNGYMGAIVAGIMSSEGDILKYAGDAILAFWRVNQPADLQATLERVIRSCLDIQEECGEWNTDVDVKLTVKMGIAVGEMKMIFVGNDHFRHYVELGDVVADVNRAESFCKSGYVVLSPRAWRMCNPNQYESEVMHDGQHVRVLSRHAWIPRQLSPEVPRRPGAIAMLSPPRRMSLATSTPSKTEIKQDIEADSASKGTTSMSSELSQKTVRGIRKLRSVVKTVTAMRLEESLRLYILSPVLKKIDDNQPLEYLSEMRQVSIVFINLVLDDDIDNTKLLQQIFDIVFSHIKLVHGCLNKIFLFDKGCTFLVIFGLPGFKHERDCAHALQNSVKMKSVLDNLKGIRVVSVGVTTGTTFCGVIGHARRHEYSVIGRKVNMAARLMMHYPGKVTCEDETFQSCRLPPENFVVLVTKRMKGLRNVGIIREYTMSKGDAERSELENSIPYFEYPLLGRDLEKELFLQEVNTLVADGKRHRNIVLVGAAGIGKTRLLDTLCTLVVQQNIRVITFSMNLVNVDTSYFLARHVLRMLLSSCGYSQDVEKEPAVMETMRLCGMESHIEAVGELLSTRVLSPQDMSHEKCEARTQVFEFLTHMCLNTLGSTAFIIDDMHFCDLQSWDCLLALSDHAHCMLTMSAGSYAVEQPPCPAASKLFDDKISIVKDLYPLHMSFIAPLACQCLEAIMIPKELDRLLRERSQGVPAWVEQLLRDMYDKHQIIIRFTDLDHTSFRVSGVAPKLPLITKTANAWRTNERRPCVSMNFADVEDAMSTESEQLMMDLGLVTEKPKKSKTKSRRTCIMAPGVSASDIPVPESMKDLVIARIDSMRATEQLIIRCAAVLDPPFTREMLEEVLPQANTLKVSSSLKRLFENGTFECSSLTARAQSAYGRTEEVSHVGKCYCPKIDHAQKEKVLCNLLRFKHKLLRDTARDMLMGKQRQHLHQKAAVFFEQRIKDMRKNVPYHLFVQNSADPTRKRKDDKEEAVASNETTSERFRTILKSGEMHPHLHIILEGAVIHKSRSACLKELLPAYDKISFHYEAAENLTSLLDIQTEASHVAIVLKQNEDALKWIEKAQSTFNKLMTSSNKQADITANCKYIEAGLLRLQGKALHQNGQKPDARKSLSKAARLLDIHEPKSRISTTLQLAVLRMSRFPQFIYFTRGGSVRELSAASRRRTERSHLLGELCRLHKDLNNKDLLILDAWRHSANIIGKNVNIHQVLESYVHLIAACRTRGWTDRAHRLESELYATCCARSQVLQYDDVKDLATTLGESALLSLKDGKITQAVDRGKVAANIVGAMAHTRLIVRIYPILAFAYLAADRHEDCLELLDKMKEIYVDLEGWGVDLWSTAISIELILSPGVPTQTFLMCLKKANVSLKNYDAAIDGNTAKYLMGMSIALWFARKSQWSDAQPWFEHWENYEVPEVNYFTMNAQMKKLEYLTLAFTRGIEVGQNRQLEKVHSQILEELPRMQKLLKTVPGLAPRFHQIRAYFCLLTGRTRKLRQSLVKSVKMSIKQGNVLQFRAVRHCWMEWSDQLTHSSLDTSWLEKVESQHMNWIRQTTMEEEVVYPFPLPKERTKKSRWLRGSRVTPQSEAAEHS